MQKIALLGASGMIGSAVKAELEGACDIVTLGRRATSDVSIDLFAPESITPGAFAGVSAIVHCAGVVDEDFKESSQPGFLKGTYSAKKLAESAFEAGVRTFVYVSSAHIYGPLNGTLSEDSPPNPVSDYGISHYATEQIFRRTALKDKAGRLLILRPCATYGVPDVRAFQRWSLIPFLFPKKAVSEGKISLLAGSDQISRNFISAKAIGEHILSFLNTASAGTTLTVNPVGAYEASVLAFARRSAAVYEQVTGQACDVSMAEGAVSHPPALHYTSRHAFQPNGESIDEFLTRFISLLQQQKDSAP